MEKSINFSPIQSKEDFKLGNFQQIHKNLDNENLNNLQNSFNSNVHSAHSAHRSLNSLENFNFETENSSNDMLEQVKKIMEYNTNFINKQVAVGNNNNNNNEQSTNSLYFNSNTNSKKLINNNSYTESQDKKDNISSTLNDLKIERITNGIIIKKNLDYNNNNNNNEFKDMDNFDYCKDKANKNQESTANVINSANINPFQVNNNNNFSNSHASKFLNNNNNNSNNNSNFNSRHLTGNFNFHNTESSNKNNNNNNNNKIPLTINNNNNNNPLAKLPENFGSFIRTSRNSRSASMSILNDYKISLDGKINNLKKMINKKIGFSRMKSLDNSIMKNILQFFDTSDLNGIFFMNKYMKNKILSIISEYAKNIKFQFEEKFKKFFLLKKSFIYINTITKRKKKFSKINFTLQFQINETSLKNKSLIVGYFCKFYGDQETHKNFFRFDVKPPGPLSFWVMREYTSVRNFLIFLIF